MAEKANVSVSGGVGFPTLLFLVFLVLKLTGVIAWSWVWVTAPLWISLGLSVVALVVFLAIVGIIAWLGRRA